MPDNYTEFFEKLGEIDAAVRETECACVELPPTVAKELYNGAIYYMKADKEFSEGNEEKASEKLNRAVTHAYRASANALEFHYLFYPRFARSVIDELKEHKEEHKEIVPEYIIDCDETIKNLSEIITLTDGRKTIPETKAAYGEKVKKLLRFSSYFERTDEWGFFSRRYFKLKMDFHGVPNNYAQLKHDFSEKFSKIETVVEAATEEGENFLPHVAKKLYYGVFSCIKADKELFVGNEKWAIIDMKEAIGSLNQALFDVLRFRLLVCLREVRDICTKKIKGNKTVVLACEPKYGKHFKNLHTIIKNIENMAFPSEEPEKIHAYYKENIKNLQDFLDDFEKDEGKLVEAINGKETPRQKKIRFWLSILSSSLGEFIGRIVKH